MRSGFSILCSLILCGCARDAIDPMRLTPSAPYATWTPREGSQLISSRYCKTLLPEKFGNEEMNLAELIDIALINSPLTKQTWAQARASAAALGEVASKFFPEISTSSTYIRQKGSFPVTGAFESGSAVTIGSTVQNNAQALQVFYSTQAGPDVNLSYTLFDFGQRTAAAMAAREALYYADLNHNQEIQTVMQTVMDDTYNYLYQRAALAANEANLANAQISLDAANERFSLGLAALGDVASARTQFLQNRIQLTSQKQTVENAFAMLAVDLGLPANVPFKVQPMPENVVADPLLESVAQLVEVAQVRRQDFLAARADVRSKEASLLQAKRAPMPVLTTKLDTGHYWFQDGLSEQHMHWIGTLILNVPIFDGFKMKNAVRKAEANLDFAKAELYQKEISIIQDVTISHMNVKTSALNLADTEEYYKSAELEFNIAIANYKAGTKTILDLLSAQSSLADARSKKAEAKQNWFTSLTSIAYATGSLCASPNEDTLCRNE